MILENNIYSNIGYVIIIIFLAVIFLSLKTIRKVWANIFNYHLLTITILYLVPLAGIIGITAPLLFGMYNFTMLGSYLAIPMIIASLFYWLYFYRTRSDDNDKNEGA